MHSAGEDGNRMIERLIESFKRFSLLVDLKRSRMLPKPIIAAMEQQAQYERHNQEAAAQGPRTITYNASVQRRKEKSQKQNWKHWGKRK